MSLSGLRAIIVTGKGGVGKSTVSAALGLQAAARGLRTLIAEISGAQRMADVFGVPGIEYAPTPLAERLWGLSITPEAAIEDYVVQQIKFRRLYKLVFRNRVMAPFVDAVPGLHDAVQLGKVFDLEQETGPDGRPVWDLIIVDAPATGHGLTMLHSARSMMDLTRAGPLYEGVSRVHEVIDNPDLTSIVLVCLPEEIPVNETIDLWERLGASRDQVSVCVLNEMFHPPFDPPGDWAAARPTLAGSADPAVQEAVALADQWLRRIDRQDRCRARLREHLPVAMVEVPFRFHRNLTRDELADTGRRLARMLPPARDPADPDLPGDDLS